MKETLKKIKEEALSAIADDSCDLEALRIQYLGKKGELTAVLRGMGKLTPEERPIIGQLANEIRGAIEQAIEQKVAQLKSAEQAKKLLEEKIVRIENYIESSISEVTSKMEDYERQLDISHEEQDKILGIDEIISELDKTTEI